MVSGWDKHPPEHEPEFGPGGKLLTAVIVGVVIAIAAGLVGATAGLFG